MLLVPLDQGETIDQVSNVKKGCLAFFMVFMTFSFHFSRMIKDM